MSSIKDNIDPFHNLGIFFPTKTIDIFGDIDDEMKSRVVRNLHALDSTNGEITILISSSGGCVESGLQIYDAIRALKNNVSMIAYGGVSSMASVIFQAADHGKRFMTPNSYLMLHEGQRGVIDTPKNKKEWERLQLHQNEICYKIYLSKIKEIKPRFSKNKLIELLEYDKIFLPNEAIKFGLADKQIEVY